jgi:hypothetical protein
MKVRFICRINIVLIKSIQLYLLYKLKTNTMKKVLLAVAVVAFFASCKKDYTCTCNDGFGTNVITYSSVSGSNANYLQAKCESENCVWDIK